MNAAQPSVSVVVATKDRPTRLDRLLRSLDQQRLEPGEFEVIVVDDGSKQATRELVERWRRKAGYPLAVVSLERSAGPAAARNAGWRRSRAALVAFTDDDCEAGPEWLGQLIRASHPEPDAVVQGRTIPLAHELDRLGPFSRTKRIEEPGPWFQTCNIAYPRKLLERLNGFDEVFPEALGEDTDLGWRALAVGATHTYAPEAVVGHAVEDLGPLGYLRDALRGSDAVLVFRRHPRLRARVLGCGMVRTRAHVLLLLAAGGLFAAQRFRPAFLLAFPYCRELLGRCRARGGSPMLAPYFAVHDSLRLYTTLRGALRHRVPVL